MGGIGASGAATTSTLESGSPLILTPRPGAASAGVTAIAWFGPEPLRSGWAWGETFLEDGIVAVSAKVGSGTVILFGPEINFRAQPHGTFKLLFNAIYTDTETAGR